jgi:hypothetical protein
MNEKRKDMGFCTARLEPRLSQKEIGREMQVNLVC